MNRKFTVTCLVVVLIGLILAGSAAGLWYVFYGRGGGEPPILRLIQPQVSLSIHSGQGLVVIVEGQSAQGLDRIEFLVDGKMEYSAPASGQSQFQAVFPWFSTTLGDHQISAVGYDRSGHASQPVAVPVRVEAADLRTMVENAQPLDVNQSIEEIIAQAEGGNGEGGAPPQAGDQPQQPGDPGANPPAGQPGNDPGGNPPADPGANPPAGQPGNDPGGNPPGAPGANPPAAGQPPQGDGEPPTVTLTVTPLRLGDDVSAVVEFHARDNAGVRIMVLEVQTPAGITNSYGLGCEENLECGDQVALSLDESGRWVFVLQATDISGQNAQPQSEAVHVMCVEFIGCALAQENAFPHFPPIGNMGIPILGENPILEPIDAAESWLCRGLEPPQESYIVERSQCQVILPVDIAQGRVTQCPGDILQQGDFRGVDLRNANFFGANLEWADLTCHTDLRGADLRLTHLFGTKLDASTQLDPKWRLVWELVNAGGYSRILRGEDLNWAYLYNVDLYGSDLRGANLSGTNLSFATLLAADVDATTNFDGVIWSDTVCPDGSNSDDNGGTCIGHMNSAWPPNETFWIGQCRIILPVNLALGPYTDCKYADMNHADLRHLDLRRANFEGTNFGYADMRGTNLTGANLYLAWLHYSKMDNTTQIDAKWRLAWKIVNLGARNQDLRGADLHGARLYKGQLVGANLTGADLGYADLTDAQMANATLVNANFTGADLTGADLTGADITGAIWHETTCPDGTFSENVGGTCEGHLNF